MLRAARNRNFLKQCVYFDKRFKISYWANHFSEAKNIIVWGDQKDKGPRAEHQPLKYKVSFFKCKVLASFKLSWQTQLQQLYSHSELKSQWFEGGRGGTKKISIWGGSTLRSHPFPFHTPLLTEKEPLSYAFYFKRVPLSHS